MSASAGPSDDQILAIDIKQFDARHYAARAIMVRQRYLMGLREAFEKTPELAAIRCRFSHDHSGTRSILRDTLAVDTEGNVINQHLQACLERDLLPMRRALGADGDTYRQLAKFFNYKTVDLTRDMLLASFGHLVHPETEILDDEVIAGVQAEGMEHATPSVSGKRSSPRL